MTPEQQIETDDKMNTKPLLLSLLTCAMLAGIGINPAVAQSTYTPGIDRAQDDLSARIQQGVTAGRISRQEADELARRERGIQIRESRMKADGGADQREREQLRGELAGLRADVENMIARPPVVAPMPITETREYQVRDRIEQGVENGNISRREARRFNSRARDLERHEASYKADGVFTRSERIALRRESDALRNDVERMLRANRGGQVSVERRW